MNVGFTYDLKDEYLADGYDEEDAAEFDKPDTIDAIDGILTRLGHRVERIGRLDRLVAALAAGSGWDLVFNIAEGSRGMGREAQVPALLEAYGIPVTFGDSLCLAVCLHKGQAKHIVRSNGLPTPRFAVAEDAYFDFQSLDLPYPLFVKPIAEGTGKGVTPRGKVGDAGALRDISLDLLERYRQPVLVEEFLPGREFTVGIVGSGRAARVIGVMEVVLLDKADSDAYTYDNKDRYEERVSYRLASGEKEADAAAEIALAAYQALGCRDAGRIDMRSDAGGRPHFIEANPLAGLNPKSSDLPILCRLAGMEYEQLISEIVDSAMGRIVR